MGTAVMKSVHNKILIHMGFFQRNVYRSPSLSHFAHTEHAKHTTHTKARTEPVSYVGSHESHCIRDKLHKLLRISWNEFWI